LQWLAVETHSRKFKKLLFSFQQSSLCFFMLRTARCINAHALLAAGANVGTRDSSDRTRDMERNALDDSGIKDKHTHKRTHKTDVGNELNAAPKWTHFVSKECIIFCFVDVTHKFTATKDEKTVSQCKTKHNTTNPYSYLLWRTVLKVDTTTGALGAHAANLDAPIVTQTAVRANLLQALEIITEGDIDGVGEDVRVLAGGELFASVQEPHRDLELARVLHNSHDTVDLGSRALAGTLVNVHIGLLQRKRGEAAANALDGGERVANLATAINVRVRNTKNVHKVCSGNKRSSLREKKKKKKITKKKKKKKSFFLLQVREKFKGIADVRMTTKQRGKKHQLPRKKRNAFPLNREFLTFFFFFFRCMKKKKKKQRNDCNSNGNARHDGNVICMKISSSK
jgi:hypothetical protein